MWGVDDDHSRWIGGLVVDAAHQRHGVGRAAVIEAIRLLIAQPDCAGIALSYHPANHAARSLYAALGFSDTGETAEDGSELVSRLRLDDAQTLAGIEGPDEPRPTGRRMGPRVLAPKRETSTDAASSRQAHSSGLLRRFCELRPCPLLALGVPAPAHSTR